MSGEFEFIHLVKVSQPLQLGIRLALVVIRGHIMPSAAALSCPDYDLVLGPVGAGHLRAPVFDEKTLAPTKQHVNRGSTKKSRRGENNFGLVDFDRELVGYLCRIADISWLTCAKQGLQMVVA
jgi:hypothetical protein